MKPRHCMAATVASLVKARLPLDFQTCAITKRGPALWVCLGVAQPAQFKATRQGAWHGIVTKWKRTAT